MFQNADFDCFWATLAICFLQTMGWDQFQSVFTFLSTVSACCEPRLWTWLFATENTLSSTVFKNKPDAFSQAEQWMLGYIRTFYPQQFTDWVDSFTSKTSNPLELEGDSIINTKKPDRNESDAIRFLSILAHFLRSPGNIWCRNGKISRFWCKIRCNLMQSDAGTAKSHDSVVQDPMQFLIFRKSGIMRFCRSYASDPMHFRCNWNFASNQIWASSREYESHDENLLVPSNPNLEQIVLVL